MILDTAGASLEELYQLLAAVIVPRPIALVSSVSPDGIRNLAPFSSFMPIPAAPPLLAFAPTTETGRPKDTVANILATGEFVVNIVAATMAVAMNDAAADHPPEIDEFTVSGFTPLRARHVGPPLVAGSPASFECRLIESREYGRAPAITTLIIGEVLAAHVPDNEFPTNSPAVMSSPRPILGQLGLDRYCDTSDRISLP